MSNLMIKEFNGNQVHIFMWQGRPCWIANEVVSMFGYADPSSTIGDCIEVEKFENGIEYDVLTKDELRKFKKMVNSLVGNFSVSGNELTRKNLVSPNTPNLTIFYEDGLYGFLEYTHKPEGVQFRKWLRREVLPEIQETGAYISDKADPDMLRLKADKLESIAAVNQAARIILPELEAAGMKSEYRLLTLQQIYRKAGLTLPLPALETTQQIYDLTTIAQTLGIYSKSGKPHAQAVGAIVSNLDISENEKVITSYERNGHMGTNTQYTKAVIDKASKWLADHNRPGRVVGKSGQQFTVMYGQQEGR